MRSLLTEKILRVKPEDFCQLIKTETEVVLSILKHFHYFIAIIYFAIADVIFVEHCSISTCII